jgi:hypothetical protein
MLTLQAMWSFPAHDVFLPGYIDPGIVSMALQAVFVFLFGAMTAYLTAPWRWLRSLLPVRKVSAADDADAVDAADESPAEEKRRAA